VTLIERCVVVAICIIGIAMGAMLSSLALGAEVATSTQAEALDFAVKQISNGELTGVIAGLFLILGALMRNAAVRAAMPVLVEWLASRWTHKRRAEHRRKRAKRER
jgi:hypothetical protein